MKTKVSIITVTLNRVSLEDACASIDRQSYPYWHHYVIGDGVLPSDYAHSKRTSFGFSRALGAEEPGLNKPDGTPNPLQRWALKHLDISDFVCFLDDDNIYKQDFLEEMVSLLEKNRSHGIALCGVEDRRYHQNIDGFPEIGHCDNSGFMARGEAVKSIPFPFASMEKEVIQDVEYICTLSKVFGWVRTDKCLVVFGNSPDLPPKRNGVKLVTSWEGPFLAMQMIRKGDKFNGIKQLEKWVKEDPLDGWSLWQLAEAFLVTQQKDRALSCWQQWIKLTSNINNPFNDYIYYCQAVAKFAIGDDKWQESLNYALIMVESRIKDSITIAEPYFSRGLYSLWNNEFSKSVSDFQYSLKLSQRSGELDDVIHGIKLLGLLQPEKNEIITTILNFVEKNRYL
ncbi:glycosyltransferase family A protein [Microcoleus sp. T2B6]|uniref:glycosyltransferase family A protein n=1 Tax=Microcoleus sp. T2B6 TaxID=3055424 RepID=UPI002FCEBBED